VADDHLTREDSDGESWVVPRPFPILMELPVSFRWEVTRRNPYYLRFWALSHRHYEQPSQEDGQRAEEEAAVLILHAIGVNGDPPHPGASAEELGTQNLTKGWESGAVAPVTFRGLIDILLTDLPGEAQRAVGKLLIATADSTPANPSAKYQALLELQNWRVPVLSAIPNRPLFGVNIQAPQRVILKAVEKLVREWKSKEDIGETRRRDDKLEDYLAVWDLREGWAADHYEGDREQSLRSIAQRLAIPLATVANRYRSAFRFIVGRDYSPDLWARALGLIKMSEWLDPEHLPKLASRRPWRHRQPRLVPDTVLQAGDSDEGSGSILNSLGISPAEISVVDLVMDIQELLTKGLTNEAIAVELELSPDALEMIEQFRQRYLDDL
jgi:DNA-binding Lrp family transcriptional regulator